MTDIFHEVEADLRREKAASLWQRFGGLVLVGAVLIVVGVAGWRGYVAWDAAREQQAGDRYVALMAEADSVRTVGPAEALLAFAADAPGDMGVFARLRAATSFDQAGEAARAEETLRSVVDDAAAPDLYRNVARVRLGQVLLDRGDTAATRDLLGPIAQDPGNPMTHAAQELVGLAAYTADDLETARATFTALGESVETSAPMRQRATAMLALLKQVAPSPAPAVGSGASTPAPAAEADAPAGEGPTPVIATSSGPAQSPDPSKLGPVSAPGPYDGPAATVGADGEATGEATPLPTAQETN